MLTSPPNGNHPRTSQVIDVPRMSHHSDVEPNESDIQTPTLMAMEVDEYQKHYNSSAQESQMKMWILGVIAAQLCLSSLRAPLYLRIHYSPIIRTAWRQGFTAIIYIPIGLIEYFRVRQSNEYSFSLDGKYKQLMYASMAQSIFAVSLSISVQYTHVSHALMFYNSSLLVYCGYKIFNGYKSTLELIGFNMSIGLLLIIIFNHSYNFYAKKQSSLFDSIVMGDLCALFGGSVFSLIYAKYYCTFQMSYPQFTLGAIIRVNSTILLIIMTMLFDNNHDMFGFIANPQIFTELFLNALFTGVLMNYLQNIVQRQLDPLSYNTSTFFQPLLGSVFSYLLGQESFPSILSILVMILFSISLIMIQIGRSQSEAQEFRLDSIELRRFDTLVETPFVDKIARTTRLSLYPRKTQQNPKQIVDVSMDY